MSALPPSGDAANKREANDPFMGISPRTVALAVLVVVGIALLFAFVIRFHLILFLFLIAIILASITRPVVDWLAQRGVRPQVGVILVYLALFALVALLVVLLTPLIFGQIDAATQRLSTLYATLRQTLTSTDNRLVQRLALGLPEQFDLLALSAATAPPEDGMMSFAPAWSLVKTVGRGGFVVIAILALAFYWVSEGELITRRMLLFLPADRREQARTTLAQMDGAIGGFFRGQFILMGIVAALSGVGYFIVGMPYALGLALIAGICEAIPLIGPILGTAVAAFVALSLAPDKLPEVIAIGVIVQLLENNLLVPRVMNQSVGVNPIVTILAIAAFGALGGFVGVLFAIPLAAMVQIIIQQLFSTRLATSEVSRSHIGALRFAARELAADVRKGVANGDARSITSEIETAEDKLEAIATDLDRILASVEVNT